MSDKLDSTALVENMETCDDASPLDKKSKSQKAGDKADECGECDDHVPHLCLPPVIRRRVNALRKLQLESINIEVEFYRKVHELECEYAERTAPLNEKRQKIVSGLHEPNDDECNFSVPFDEEFLADELLKQEAIKRDLPETEKNTSGKGVDEFWLTAFRNSDILCGMIQSHDEPILKHLVDVEVKILKQPMMFTLVFHFSPNDYFTNTTLTKEYSMKCQPDLDDPFEFCGPEIVSCKGCKIDWKADKNVTIEIVKKKLKHKQKNATRIVSKQVKADSFFNFFDPPVVPEGGEEELDEKTAELLNADYEIGQIFRDHIIPRAVLFYTGEAKDDDEFDEDEEDEDDDDFDDEEESDDDNGHPKK
jgi:nucleosome assembly protein 1-like 1